MAKRVGYVDIAKAIAVLFIILGHTGLVFNADMTPGGVPYPVTRFAFTFHLPTFFILSGFFLHAERPLTLDGVKRDARSLLVPYAVACALTVAGAVAVAVLTPGVPAAETARRWIGASLWGAGATHPMALVQTERIGGIWFLLALFWIRILIPLTSRIPDIPRLLVMAGLLAASVLAGQHVWLPWSILSGLGCAFYVYLGWLIRKHGLFERLHGAMWAVPAALWAAVIVFGGNASLAMSVYPLGAVDVAGGVAGALCVTRLAKAIEDHAPAVARFGCWVGRNTLPIFALHIVEDNVAPWHAYALQLSQLTGGAPWSWLALLACRLAVDAVLVALAYLLPVTRPVFFPHAARSDGRPQISRG